MLVILNHETRGWMDKDKSLELYFKKVYFREKDQIYQLKKEIFIKCHQCFLRTDVFY